MTTVHVPRPPCPCGKPHKARGLCASHYRTAVRWPGGAWHRRLLPADQWMQYTYRCDTCDLEGDRDQIGALGMGTHYCYEHYPMTRCRVCSRYIRPEDATEPYWPETVSIGTRGRCHPCTRGMLEQVDIEPLPAYAVRIIKRMVEDRYDDPDDRLLILTSLVGSDTI